MSNDDKNESNDDDGNSGTDAAPFTRRWGDFDVSIVIKDCVKVMQVDVL